ncbi:MAG: purine-nucleoside phosphorylase [Alphaproteobacteria bacterium]|nr:purine-nucleoside phosphorylase [Alphaproteobacteria bacterium]
MIKQSAEYIIKSLQLHKPQIAVILGSGLGQFVEGLTKKKVIKYKDIPHFPQSSVEGHKGELIRGFIGNKEILCLNGRFHLYEGYEPEIIARTIYILKEIGIKQLIITNAAGSLRKALSPGSLMLIKDHINFSGKNPLVGRNNDDYGPRFPAINNVYSSKMRQQCLNIARRTKIKLKQGVYLMVLGPNFETPAEIAMFAKWGADAVGMSTVPEVIAAAHCSIDVLGISVITNYGSGLVHNQMPSHEETLAGAALAANNLIKLLYTFIKEEN